MKILMTTDTVGGVWTYALQLADALRAHGAEIALATMGRPLTPAQRAAADALPNVQVFESGYKLEWMQEPWADVRAAGAWLLDLAEQVRPDIVHLNNYCHGLLDWPAPVLMVGHSCVLSWYRAVRGQEAGPEWDHYREEVRKGLQAADLVVAPTEAMLRSLEDDYGPFRRRQVILNGRTLPEVPVGTKDPVVLAAGRLWDEAKNIGTLAVAAGLLPWRVCIAGDAKHPDGSTARFEGVERLGLLDPSELLDWYARATIYALPARYEPFGLTPLEAALCGCALVLGDIPTLREIWGEGAYYVPPDDASALAEGIRRLIDDLAFRRELIGHARARAQKLNAAHMAAEYEAAYRQLLSRTAPETVAEAQRNH